jgi:hypothetical protein
MQRVLMVIWVHHQKQILDYEEHKIYPVLVVLIPILLDPVLVLKKLLPENPE